MHILKRLKIQLKSAVETEAGGPSDNTFYKVWNENQRKQYIKEHPQSKFAQEKTGGNKPSIQKIEKFEGYSVPELHNVLGLDKNKFKIKIFDLVNSYGFNVYDKNNNKSLSFEERDKYRVWYNDHGKEKARSFNEFDPALDFAKKIAKSL